MNQPPLPFKHFAVPERHVALLALANAGNYPEKKLWFYPFKTRFLRAHALPDGFDLQIITLKCWCGDGIFRGMDDDRPERFWERCGRCGGTGIYLKKRIPLMRWSVNGQVFHEPLELSARAMAETTFRDTFAGLIRHATVPEGSARRAMEKLLLRYEPREFERLWWKRWRIWRAAKAMGLQWRIRRVKQLLSLEKVDEVPF